MEQFYASIKLVFMYTEKLTSLSQILQSLCLETLL